MQARWANIVRTIGSGTHQHPPGTPGPEPAQPQEVHLLLLQILVALVHP